MFSKTISIIISLFLFGLYTNYAVALPPAQTKETIYTGMIFEHIGYDVQMYAIEMHLEYNNDKLSGYYFYIKHKTKIPVSGTITNNGHFTINEYDTKGNIKATFDGSKEDGLIKGTWEEKGKSRSLNFYLKDHNADDTRNKLKTRKFAGYYVYGANNDAEKGFVGSLLVYPETDDTMLFYLNINRGAPSYNMGMTYGRIKITGEKGYYQPAIYPDCGLTFIFNENTVEIDHIEGKYECGWGGGVAAGGQYLKKNSEIPVYFTDMENSIFYINSTTLAEWENR